MSGKLSSLTDELKKTLYFFDGITAMEATPYVHQKMLRDYSSAQVLEKVNLCLKQNPCFYQDEFSLWHLNTEGIKENDAFYKTILKKKEPVSLREISKKKNKGSKKIAEEAALLSDGRFVQLENGNWSLTEWYFEPQQYSLKHLLVKSLQMQPHGATLSQLQEVINEWRPVTRETLVQVINKYPYMEAIGEDKYRYDKRLHVIHDQMLNRYLDILRRQKQKWMYEREKWQIKISNLKKQIEEISAAQREAAAALAEKAAMVEQFHNLSTQLSEKDLLLSMRKKEILRYREQLAKLESKANSILHQCRLWVKRARDKEQEVEALKRYNEKNQSSLEVMFSKLHQYKEKDRDNKAKIAELKDYYTTRIAELQTEIVELKQQLERTRENSELEERKLYADINNLSNDLKEALEREEELQRTIRLLEQELDRNKEEQRRLNNRLKPLPVRIVMKICSMFGM